MASLNKLMPPHNDASRSGDGSSARAHRWLHFAGGLVVSAACLAYIASKIDRDAFAHALIGFRWIWVVPGFVGLAIDYAMRTIRWSVLLKAAGADVTASECAAPFLGSIALNNVLPFRAGDLVRALVYPAQLGIPRRTAAASVIIERLLDLLSLLVCLGIAMALSKAAIPNWLTLLAQRLAGLGSLALVCAILFSRPIGRLLRPPPDAASRPARLRLLLAELLEDVGAMCRPRALIVLLMLTGLIWIFEASVFWAVLEGCGLRANAPNALLAMAVATLATLAPSSPGYIGPFHVAAFIAAESLGAPSTVAATFATLAHLALWLPTSLAGAIAIMYRPITVSASQRTPPQQ